jgi:hypothetical protein
MVVGENDDDLEAEARRRVDGNSFLMVMLMFVCFYLIEIGGQ